MHIARPKPGLPFSEGQPLSEHLENVARIAAEFASRFGGGLFLQIAGLLHDLGKAIEAWQRYLEASMTGSKKRPPVMHSAAGTALTLSHYPRIAGMILAYLIAGHHAGLPDGAGSQGGSEGLETAPGKSLDDVRKDGERDLAAIKAEMKELVDRLSTLPQPTLPEFIAGPYAHFSQAVPFFIRMLFSCLVDADCLDAEAVSDPSAAALRGKHASIRELLAMLENHLGEFSKPNPGFVDAERAKVQAACREAAKWRPGAFSLTAPTGAGKTLATMLFALLHAVEHGKRRVVVVIPYTSIIEQTAQVFADIFGRENVCEHHSGVSNREDESRESSASGLAADNWDAPIVVTTSVQFFESLYASRGSKCRKLHNLVDSVVILDEAQLMPVDLLAPCVEALRQLLHGYGVSAVLSTATQPAFPELEAREIIQNPPALFSRLRRTRFVWPKSEDDTVSWPDLAARLRAHDSFLCVVNTRKDARDLWTLLGEGAFHLSTMMCPQHRRDALATIRSRLAAGERTRVVSTQLVEAGVDIDFPVVYRAIAGMDSLAQAAGRCNREGKRKSLADVHIFIPETTIQPGLIGKGRRIVLKYLDRDSEELESPEIFPEYFKSLYWLANDKAEAYLKCMAKNAKRMVFPFRTIAHHFHLIKDDTVPVIVDYGDGKKIADRIRTHGLNRQTLREAQRYIVSPRTYMAEELKRQGRIEEIADGLYGLTSIPGYDKDAGLDVWDGNVSSEAFVV